VIAAEAAGWLIAPVPRKACERAMEEYWAAWAGEKAATNCSTSLSEVEDAPWVRAREAENLSLIEVETELVG
jgi:hypothetical protein